MTNRPRTPTILVIDDNEDNRVSLRLLLEGEGYSVTTAADGFSGLQQIRQAPPDLILSDLLMPGIDGIELARRIRADKSLGFIPIILVTSPRENSDKVKALDSGADDILVKPIQRLELSARVRALLKLKQSNDDLVKSREEYARLLVEAQQRASELTTLNETALAIGGQISLEQLMQLIVEKSSQLVQAKGALIYLCDQDSQTLTIHAEFHTPRSFIGETLGYGEGLGGWVVQNALPMLQNNYSQWEGRAETFANDTELTAILGIPLISSGQVIGVLEVLDNQELRHFNDKDTRLLNLLAPQAAAAISNALLYEELARQNDYVNSVLNSVNDGILMMDSDFRVVLSNPRFTELLKLEANQVMGILMRDVATLLDEALESEPSFSVESMSRILRDLRRHPDHTFNRKFEIRDPRLRTLEWSAWPVRNRQNLIMGWVNVFHDISEQQALESLREDFINMLVHDLRNPLTSIIGGIEIVMTPAEEGGLEPAHHLYLMETIKKNSYVLLDMINQLLEVNRLEAGKLALDLQVVSLDELIESSLAQVELIAEEKKISLKKMLPEAPVQINVDEEKMRRLLVNLLMNALKFSSPKSEIWIEASVEEGVRRRGTTSGLDPSHSRQSTTQFLRERYAEDAPRPKALLLTVKDFGLGIPAEELGRIFEKFSQVKNQRREGFGLGLAWCKLVAEAHAGRIWADSELGKGSSFSISVPCVISPDPAKEYF